jgi:hypothetical protein
VSTYPQNESRIKTLSRDVSERARCGRGDAREAALVASRRSSLRFVRAREAVGLGARSRASAETHITTNIEAGANSVQGISEISVYT